MDALRADRDAACEERDSALARLNSLKLSSAIIYENDEKCIFYTGLQWGVFLTTYEFLSQHVKATGQMPLMDQFFMTLVKLKHDMKFEYLADQVAIPESTVIDYFWKWVDLVHAKLHFLVRWPDRDHIFSVIPPSMKVLFPRLTGIIDCFEIFIEAPGNLKARAQCWSNYKHHTTMKFLISCNPLGAINFLSSAWGGRVSDVHLVRHSGLLSLPDHHPGDQILADRGFTMREEFATMAGLELLVPAFTKGRAQFSAQDIERSRQLSSVRIHIERVIGLMKNRYAILQGIIPLRMVNSLKNESLHSAFSSADKLVGCCAILTNLSGGIVYKESD